MLKQGKIFPNEFLKIYESLQIGQPRYFGSSVEASIIKMFTMTRRPKERERERGGLVILNSNEKNNFNKSLLDWVDRPSEITKAG